MPKSHRAIQHWEHWLREPLGLRLLDAEKNILPSLLKEHYGKHAMLIGVANQSSLLKFNHMPHQIMMSPLTGHKHVSYRVIEGSLYELPVASASVDLVLLPHTFEYVDNPYKLLSEACRVVKMEGLIIIFGINPFSLWGLKKKLTKRKISPWDGNFISPRIVKKWLTLADFELVKQSTLFFRPPLSHQHSIFDKLKFIEWLGSKCWGSFGGVYMLMAKAKGIPLTPIKMHWKQQLSGVKASFSGPSMGHWQ